jgi:hypothetical protein
VVGGVPDGGRERADRDLGGLLEGLGYQICEPISRAWVEDELLRCGPDDGGYISLSVQITAPPCRCRFLQCKQLDVGAERHLRGEQQTAASAHLVISTALDTVLRAYERDAFRRNTTQPRAPTRDRRGGAVDPAATPTVPPPLAMIVASGVTTALLAHRWLDVATRHAL